MSHLNNSNTVLSVSRSGQPAPPDKQGANDRKQRQEDQANGLGEKK